MRDDIEAARDLIASGDLLSAVEKQAGRLST